MNIWNLLQTNSLNMRESNISNYSNNTNILYNNTTQELLNKLQIKIQDDSEVQHILKELKIQDSK